MMPEEMKDTAPNEPNRRPMLIGGIAAVFAGCCALLLIAGLVLVVDPFGLKIIPRLTGRYDAAASVMPADTTIYAGVNLVNFNPAEIGRLTRPFIEAAGDPDVDSFEGAQDEFQEQIQSELGIDIETDIVPWLGQYLGFGLTDVAFNNFGGVDSISWIFAAEARNRDRADEFLIKLRDALADSSGVEITEQTYKDATIYVMHGNDPDEQIAFGRSDGVVIIGATLADLQAAIDAQEGDSLDEGDIFRKVIGELPRGRALTVYTDGEGIRGIVNQSQETAGLPVGPESLPLTNYSNSGTAVSIVDAGLQIDLVSYFDQNELSTSQQAIFEASTQPRETAERLPSQTVGFLSGRRLDLVWLAIREGTGDDAGFDESMDAFGREFGLNPNTDLFPLLNGEWVIALIAGQSGLLAEELDVPLGVALVVETDQPAEMAGVVDTLRESVEGQLLVVNEAGTGNITTYEVSLSEGDSPAFSFGLADQYFFLSSSSETAVDILSEGPNLAQNEQYQAVVDEFSNDYILSFYLDVRNLLGSLREGQTGFELEDFNEAVQFIEPIEAVAVGNTFSDDIYHGKIIIFINTDKE